MSQFGTAERESFASHLSQFGTRSANHLSQFGTAERESFESVRDRGARVICESFESVRDAERESFESVRDAERESFESVRDRGAQII